MRWERNREEVEGRSPWSNKKIYFYSYYSIHVYSWEEIKIVYNFYDLNYAFDINILLINVVIFRVESGLF